MLSASTLRLQSAQQDAQPVGVQIGSIETAGNQNTERRTILSKVRSRAGDNFDPNTAAEDVKRITTLPGIQRGWYNTTIVDGKVKLTFVVVERDVVRSIEFTGNKKYKAGSLRKKLDFKKGDFLDPLMAESGKEKLLEHYRSNGYPFAAVSLDTEKLSAGNVSYTINEGSRVKITSISYSGNKLLKTPDLKKIAKLRTKKFLVFSEWYTEENIEKDIINLQNAYYKRGFLNVSIETEKKYNADKSKVQIIFRIKEGPIYKVNKIIIEGAEKFDKQKLLAVIKSVQGKAYDKLQGDADTKELVRLYRENGFINASVEQNLKFVAEDKIDIEYAVKEGRQFRIGEITITGNRQTQDKVVRRILDEYDFTPGKLYNADIAHGDGNGDLEKIVKAGTYSELATITTASEKQNQKDALVNIAEGKTGSIMAGAGISADSGVIGQISFEERNFDIKNKPKSFSDFITGNSFKGAGQQFRVSLEPGTQLSQYLVSFTEPYLNDKPVSLDLAGSSWMRFRESYDEDRLKGFVGFEKRYRDRWRRNIGFRLENVDIVNLDYYAPKEVRDVKGRSTLAGVRLGISKDMTDDRFNPGKGYTFDTGYEQVSGEYTFGKLNAFYQRFFTLNVDLAERKTVLAAKLYGATTVGDAPLFEKYYAGGSGTNYGIRGFQYRGVSPRGRPTTPDGLPIPGAKKEDPIGSDWIALANAEVTVPLIGDNISLLLFTDSGMIDTGSLRASTGTGIQILIPQWFGPVPMRFELAYPFLKDNDDKTQVFSFSIGRLF